MIRIVVLSLLILLIVLPSSPSAENLTVTEKLYLSNRAFTPDGAMNRFMLSPYSDPYCCKDSPQISLTISRDRAYIYIRMEPYMQQLIRDSLRKSGDWKYLYRDTLRNRSAKTRYFLQSRIAFWRSSENGLVLDIDFTRPSRVARLSYLF